MKKTIASLTLPLVLVACAPVSVYYKQGGSVSRLQSDLLACEVDALAKAPVASQIRRGPPRYVPGGRYCRPDGICYHRAGYYISGEVYSVDVNARLRHQLEIECMAQKGYRPVELPRCQSGVTPSVTPAGPGHMPPLTEATCAARDAEGRWQIIDPAW